MSHLKCNNFCHHHKLIEKTTKTKKKEKFNPGKVKCQHNFNPFVRRKEIFTAK